MTCLVSVIFVLHSIWMLSFHFNEKNNETRTNKNKTENK